MRSFSFLPHRRYGDSQVERQLPGESPTLCVYSICLLSYDPPEDIGSFGMGFDYSVWSPILRCT